jgi:hypothetical protein
MIINGKPALNVQSTLHNPIKSTQLIIDLKFANICIDIIVNANVDNWIFHKSVKINPLTQCPKSTTHNFFIP